MDGKRKGIKVNLKRIAPILLIFMAGSTLIYNRYQTPTQPSVSDLPQLSLAGVHSLLVVAPHPDDESLGAGGLVQGALAQGIQAHVVVVTNGDGQEIAPVALGMEMIPDTADFVAIGERRQKESLAALQKLGLPPSAAFYLSYPDRGTKPMWLADWNSGCPYYSKYTKSTSSPYPLTYNPSATYCGWDVLHDLQSIIATYKPDLVVVSHPDDQHPDHLAVSNFTRLAIALENQLDPSYMPSILGYMVHYANFPVPIGHHPAIPLLPPTPLSGPEYQWERLDLTPQQVQTKIAAVAEYSSQIHLMEDFLVSFDRPNELFMQLSMPKLFVLANVALPAPVSTGGDVNYSEPTVVTERLLQFPGADLIGWGVSRLGDTLILNSYTLSPAPKGIQYSIFLKTPDGATHTYSLNDPNVQHSLGGFTTQVSLVELGNPSVLAFSAETQRDVMLDRTGWEFILLGITQTPAPTPEN
jgi:LmbE family N-acetylglucosaminyl deacetylase